MKVQELIAALMEMPGDAEVIVYCAMSEDADWANGVLLSELGAPRRGSGRPYVKGDWPDHGMTKDEQAKLYINSKHVVIIK